MAYIRVVWQAITANAGVASAIITAVAALLVAGLSWWNSSRALEQTHHLTERRNDLDLLVLAEADGSPCMSWTRCPTQVYSAAFVASLPAK